MWIPHLSLLTGCGLQIDTLFKHEGLISERNANKHSEFPGPSFWHFPKHRETYCRFAGELFNHNGQAYKKLVEKTIAKGMTDVFQDSKNVYMQQRSQPEVNWSNEKTQKRIRTDIYDCQQDVLQQNGLANSDDEEDIYIKLQSLQLIWETLSTSSFYFFL